MRTYHELFKRSVGWPSIQSSDDAGMLTHPNQLQLQNNSEVPAWFPVDSRRYSIRLTGRPQYVRGSGKGTTCLLPESFP